MRICKYIEAAIYITFSVAPKLKSSLYKFYGRHHDLVDSYEISVSQMNGSYSFFADFFLYITDKTFTGLYCIYE
jgi:hypothetical protein